MLVQYLGGPRSCERQELDGRPPRVVESVGGHYVYDGHGVYGWHVGAQEAGPSLAKPSPRARGRA